MKRGLLLLLTAALCLLLAAACGAEEAGQTRLLITDAAYDPESGLLTVNWTNTGEEAVTGAELRAIPRDADENQLVIGEGNLEEILLEQRVYHTFAAAAPGESATAVFPAGARYPAAAAFDVAFDAVIPEGGVALDLPDSRLCWYSTQEKAYTHLPEAGEPYAPLAEEIVNALKKIDGIEDVSISELQ